MGERNIHRIQPDYLSYQSYSSLVPAKATPISDSQHQSHCAGCLKAERDIRSNQITWRVWFMKRRKAALEAARAAEAREVGWRGRWHRETADLAGLKRCGVGVLKGGAFGRWGVVYEGEGYI